LLLFSNPKQQKTYRQNHDWEGNVIDALSLSHHSFGSYNTHMKWGQNKKKETFEGGEEEEAAAAVGVEEETVG
jgi:hypothetical protein